MVEKSSKIPKIIHYCWFGRNPKPEQFIKYLEGWKKNLNDYKFIEWNEDNFDVSINKFVREAFESKKWAFITDYVRLYALYNYGGIYMDTDVEVLKNLDPLLDNLAFSGMEDNSYCVTGTMGAIKHHKWIKLLLDYYEDKSFINPDGSFNIVTNTKIITDITISKYGWVANNSIQKLDDGLTIYPFDYLCAKSNQTGKLKITQNTFTVHNFNGSWLSEKEKKTRIIREKSISIFGKKVGGFISTIINSIRINGLIGTIKKIFRRRK